MCVEYAWGAYTFEAAFGVKNAPELHLNFPPVYFGVNVHVLIILPIQHEHRPAIHAILTHHGGILFEADAPQKKTYSCGVPLRHEIGVPWLGSLIICVIIIVLGIFVICG